jgi:hypothetical protein
MQESTSAISFIVYVGMAMVVSAIIGAILAGIKNRDISYWTAWGFLFPPSLLVLALLPKHKGPRPRRPTLAEEERRLDDF